MAAYPMLACAGLLLLMGTVHLAYTFFGANMRPREAEVEAAMKTSHPGVSRRTTMWKCWIGFNVTHSFCMMLFALVYGYLAHYHPDLLFGSSFLTSLGLVLLLSLAAVAKVYFFFVPLRGVLLALALYASAVGLAQL